MQITRIIVPLRGNQSGTEEKLQMTEAFRLKKEKFKNSIKYNMYIKNTVIKTKYCAVI